MNAAVPPTSFITIRSASLRMKVFIRAWNCPSTASAVFRSCPYSKWSEGFNLFVGDSLDDRLLFWNQHHRQEEQWVGAISALRIPACRLADAEFLGLIKTIVRQRGRRTSRGLVW
jgi:hypothetical protein